MRYGVTMMATDETMDVAELARAVEERGLDSLYLPEHTHIPAIRTSPWPGGGELPREYARTLDPVVAMTAAATATERLRVGTGVLLPAQHDPITTAKALATLDHLSGGRVTLGVGFGWNVEEAADHGVAWPQRRHVAREHVLAMQALWREDEASFAGEHVRFERVLSWPKPAQRDAAGRPAVPVLVGGGAGPTLFAHVAEYADGWMPLGGGGLGTAVPRLRAAFEEAGRDPVTMQVVPFAVVPTPEKLDHYARLGVTEAVCFVPSATRDEALPWLDDLAAVIAAHRGG
jgi:probable F420-dependent oxidoreductase